MRTVPATIYDVAERAGVSISTVSLALNQPTRVAATTRQRVLSAIDELGFTPKATAVHRARTAVRRIGVIAPFSSYSSFGERLSGVLEVAREHDLEVVLYDAESAAASTHPLISTLPITQSLDALIVMSLLLEPEAAERLRRSGLTTVLLDIAQPGFTSIVVDDAIGGYLAGKRLVEGGKTRFAVITETKLVGDGDYEYQGDRRIAGFRRAVAEAGLDPDAIQVCHTTNDIEGGSSAAAALLDASAEPLGIFGHHDLLAIGALQEARRRGRSVPDEVAVVGFDDGEVARVADLTTIRQPLRYSGVTAARSVLDALAQPSAPKRQITLDLELVVRGSA